MYTFAKSTSFAKGQLFSLEWKKFLKQGERMYGNRRNALLPLGDLRPWLKKLYVTFAKYFLKLSYLLSSLLSLLYLFQQLGFQLRLLSLSWLPSLSHTPLWWAAYSERNFILMKLINKMPRFRSSSQLCQHHKNRYSDHLFQLSICFSSLFLKNLLSLLCQPCELCIAMPFEDLLKRTRDRRKWNRFVHEATNPQVEDVWRQVKTSLSPQFADYLFSQIRK